MFSIPKLKAAIVCGLLSLTPQVQAIETGAIAPDCKLKHLADGKPISLPNAGKVLYVDFWASWCGPCLQSMPFMNELQQQYKTQGLEVIAVNLDENKEDAELFLKNHPVNVTVATNEDGNCPTQFDVQAMPSSYLIDKKGKIRHVQLGFHSSETKEMREKVKSLLEEN
jgi:thiol-disulfide isomerase/thioredoxin